VAQCEAEAKHRVVKLGSGEMPLSFDLLSHLIAATATFTLKAGLWFLRGRFVMVISSLTASCCCCAENPLIPAVQFSRATSVGSNPAVLSTAGRGRVNIHGAVNLETFDAPFVEPTTVDGVSTAQLLTKIEARNPDKRIIHVIWDNAAYHKGPDVRAFLARASCRIHLIQLPPYCPHLNPIERLWAVLHQYVTHNRYYPSQK
jgi:transposase